VELTDVTKFVAGLLGEVLAEFSEEGYSTTLYILLCVLVDLVEPM
jgi:hypothetical protein